MSALGNFFRAILPFSKTASADVEKEVQAILNKANLQAAAVRVKATEAQIQAKAEADIAAVEAFAKQHVAFIRAKATADVKAAALPTPPVPPTNPLATGPTGPTGPTGA